METKAEQFYPTYTFQSGSRDILLLEFEEAQKIANGQTKVYGQVTNILLAIVTLIFPFILEQDDKNKALLLVLSNSILFSLILFIFGAILLRYFVDLQRQITINARKVVTLRTLLGLDYGHIHLTLPNWRVEGATNPFVIKYFNGWLNFKTTPFWLLTISVNMAWWLATKDQKIISLSIFTYSIPLPWLVGNIIFTTIYFFIFRRNLNDRHETVFLNFVKTICFFLRIKLLNNFEYIIYRAKLSYIEIDRLNVNYEVLNKILIDIEDKDFNSNMGFSLKSILRGFLSRFEYFRKKRGYIKHGGSTITMQLTRSLFIPSNQNKYLRKVSELLLSLWLTQQFSKKEILKLYISSVRYERSVLGLSNSIKYFFGDIKNKTLSSEEAFFLVERLSNITSSVNWDRINQLTKRTNVEIDDYKLKIIYKEQINSGRLKEYSS